ncbi:MAG: NupC/NupG family nucleoside CNT transporter [Bacteroidia bacterium]|nr:NupC/NupG family nucleoside CNT transporter [Bacteroidia bacterium]MDW8347226.1 nucleoside transporter C-terminal domain-containing protein [Bacteroidia bacterium]
MILTHIFRGLLGITILLGIAYVFSYYKKQVSWKLVGTGLLLQITFAVLVIRVPLVRDIFAFLGSLFTKILAYQREGAKFVFGDLAMQDKVGFIFATQILPTIVFFSALMSALYYLGILQKVVYAIAWVISKSMKLSGAESLAAASNIFLGQTEAPLLIKPFVSKMTLSELLTVMTAGMATIAGGVMASFIGLLGGTDPVKQQLFATHLLSASVMAAPGAIVFSKIILPQTEPEKIDNKLVLSKESIGGNIIEAISMGTLDGLKLAANVGAMLIAFIAIIFMLNSILSGIGEVILVGSGNLNTWIEAQTNGNFKKLDLQLIFGLIFQPIAWIIGVEWQDTMIVGRLLGEKTVINEYVGYISLSQLKGQISERSTIIATYALCGFSNFASIGIQIGGIGTIAPEQRANLAKLGLRALLAGSLSCFMTACIAGMLL